MVTSPQASSHEFSCGCLNGHRKFGWKKSGFFIFILGGFVAGAIVIPYIIVVAEEKLPAFIPFISQAGGAPPRTGILAVCLIATGFTGALIFPSFFESINQRNKSNSKLIRWLNYSSIGIAALIIFGCIVTASFPVDNTGLPNQFEWVVLVLLEHSIGASFILVGIVIYQSVVTWIWWMLPGVTRTEKFIKLALCVVYIIFGCIVLKPLPTFLIEQVGPDMNIAKLKNVTSFKLPVEFSTSYQICAFLEWAVCFVSVLYFLTLYKDFQRISCHVILRHKTCLMDILEPVPVMPLKTMS